VRNFFVGGVVHTELVDLSTDSPLKSSVFIKHIFWSYVRNKRSSSIRQKKKKGFYFLKTTFSHFDYYFVIFSDLNMFYTYKISIFRNNSENIMMAFYNANTLDKFKSTILLP